MPRWSRQRLGAVLVVFVCAAAISVSAWSGRPDWRNADSLFYQSMSFEVDGLSARVARARVFSSVLARPAVAREPSVARPGWQEFESQFFRRRWSVPIAAAVVRPVAGERALVDVAIVGYYVFAVALALLLLSRFGVVASVGVAVLCLALGPVRMWALRPLTDSWGLALEVLALLAAARVVARGGRWMPVWIAAMLALSITRELALIPLAGVALVSWRGGSVRWRRWGPKLVATGVVVTIPAYLVFGASLRLTLAFQLAGYEVPSASHSSWSYVLAHVPGFAYHTAKTDLRYMASHPVVGLAFAIGLVALFVIPAGRDTWTRLMRGAALGSVLLLAVDPDFSGFRYELPALPAAGFGLCLLAEQIAARLKHRRARTPLQAAES